MAIGDVRP
jgi:hypothetical protein